MKDYSTGHLIEVPDSLETFLVIFGVLAFLLLFSIARAEKDFLDRDTSFSLKGAAILLLILGHLSELCLKDKLFFSLGGYAAVVIFLFASGYGLEKRYGLNSNWPAKPFWRARIQRLFVPLWLTLLLFITLDFLLLDRTHAWPMVLGNFFGYLRHGRSQINGAAWFVQYILVLYVFYYLIARLPLPEKGKTGALFLATIALSVLVSVTSLREYHGICVQYALAFPAGVLTHRVSARKARPSWLIQNRFSLVVIVCLGMAVFAKWNNFFHLTPYNLANGIRSIPLLCAIVACLSLYERVNYHSRLLDFMGRHSYEIFLVHFPFMTKYDFFLFRRPLCAWFFAYAGFVVLAAHLLRLLSLRLTQR